MEKKPVYIMEDLELKITEVAALIGDKSRSLMLWYLLDGRAYTATELAAVADISAQSASNHLLKLVEGSILKVEKQGRHRYYTYFSSDVAYAIEALNTLVKPGYDKKIKSLSVPTDMAKARTCYDHMAGNLGVGVTESLLKKGIITYAAEDAFEITSKGSQWLTGIGIDMDSIKKQKRKIAFPCLDWSERRHHLAGALGTALLHLFLEKKWIKRKTNSRELILTSVGEMQIKSLFG